MKSLYFILVLSISSYAHAASSVVCTGKVVNMFNNEVVSNDLTANITDNKESTSIDFGSVKYSTGKLKPPEFDGKYYPSGVTSEGNIIQRITFKHYRFIQMSLKQKIDLFCK